METRASYIAVGAFVLILLLGGIGFGLWVSKFNSIYVFVDHFVRVEGSVAGLNTNSAVLFGGIPIGKVTRIEIDPKDQRLTRIDISVRADVPIRTDSTAVLESKSLIGGVVVEISRGNHASPRLTTPEIAAGPSSWERLLTGAPKLATKASALADQLDQFMTVQNTAALARILASTDRLTFNLGALSSRVDQVFAHGQASGTALRQSWADIQSNLEDIGKNGDRLMEDANQAILEIKRAGAQLDRTKASVDGLLAQDRAAFDNFMSSGYPQLNPMFADLKELLDRYGRLFAEIRNDPARFFLLDRSQGFQPQ